LLRDKLIDALQSFDVEYDSGLESIFGEQAPAAQIAISKSPQSKYLLDFLEDFYPFLEGQSTRINNPGKLIDFVQLSYVIYGGFREEFPEAHITPNTTFKKLGVKRKEVERNLFVQVLVKNNGFEDGLAAPEYKKMLKYDVKYTILKLAEFNEIFLK